MAEEALRDHNLPTGLVPLGMSLKGPPVLHMHPKDVTCWYGCCCGWKNQPSSLQGFSFFLS